MASSEEVFELARKQNRRSLARALYEWDDGGRWSFDKLPKGVREAFLNQADFLMGRFNIIAK